LSLSMQGFFLNVQDCGVVTRDSIRVCIDLAGHTKPPEQLVLGLMQSEPSHGQSSRSSPKIKIVFILALPTEMNVMFCAICEGACYEHVNSFILSLVISMD
jgi:hypothetical protein